jgi:hypothetical protein
LAQPEKIRDKSIGFRNRVHFVGRESVIICVRALYVF